MLAIGYFALGTRVPLNDDWMYTWSAQNLKLHPFQSALALVQIGFANVFTFGWTDVALLRLSILPFAALLGVSIFASARVLGATGYWAGLAGAAALAAPLSLTLSATFMSEIPYAALQAAACWSAAAGRPWGLTALLVLLACLQRQVGIMLPLAFTLALGRSRHQWRGLALCWAAGLLGLAGPMLAGINPQGQNSRLSSLHQQSAGKLLAVFGFLPGTVGVWLVPFLRWSLLAVLLGALWLAGASQRGAGLTDYGVFPGNLLTPGGIAPLLAGMKVTPVPTWAWVAVQVLAPLAFFSVAARGWKTGRLFWCVAATQTLPILLNPSMLLDRYYVSVAVALLPVAAACAPSLRPPSALLLASLLVFSCLLHSDYLEWQQARDRAAHMAYQLAPPEKVQAGYESNAVYVAIPYLQKHGVARERVGDPEGERLLNFGAPDAQYHLEFALRGDPRPGVAYSRGKIVIAAGP